jgi:hypothetical protein
MSIASKTDDIIHPTFLGTYRTFYLYLTSSTDSILSHIHVIMTLQAHDLCNESAYEINFLDHFFEYVF